MSIFAKLISKHALPQLPNKCTSKSTYCSLYLLQVPTNDTCLNLTKPQTVLISLLKLGGWSWLNSIKVQPLESLLPPFSPAVLGSLPSCTCKAAQLSSACYAVKKKKQKNKPKTIKSLHKNQELQFNILLGKQRPRNLHPDFPWYLRTPRHSEYISTEQSCMGKSNYDFYFTLDL